MLVVEICSDNTCVEQFMFDRNKHSNISSYFTEPDIEEDNEEAEEETTISKPSELSELDKAKLMSCIEAVKNVIGDTCPEAELSKKIIELQFNTEAVIDSILNDQTAKSKKDNKPKSSKTLAQAQSDFKVKNPSKSISNKLDFDPINFKKSFDKNDKTQEVSSLSDMMSKTSKPPKNSPSSSFSSLTDLTAHHLNRSEEKTNPPSGFIIPKMSFGNSKPLNSNTLPFNSLSDLTNHHLKSKSNAAKSPSSFIIPKMTSLNVNQEKIDNSFNSLADLAAQHLKITSGKDPKTYLSSGSGTVEVIKSEKPDKPSVFKTPKLNININKEKCSETENLQEQSKIIVEFSNLKIKQEKIDETDLNVITEVPKFNSSIIIKQEKLEISNKKMHDPLICLLGSVKKVNVNNRNLPIKSSKKPASFFGKILCRRYYRTAPYVKDIVSKSKETRQNLESQITRFDFSSPSPDALIKARLKMRNLA